MLFEYSIDFSIEFSTVGHTVKLNRIVNRIFNRAIELTRLRRGFTHHGEITSLLDEADGFTSPRRHHAIVSVDRERCNSNSVNTGGGTADKIITECGRCVTLGHIE